MPFDGSSFDLPRQEPEARPPQGSGPGAIVWAISFACVILPFTAVAVCFGLH